MLPNQEQVEFFQNQHWKNVDCTDEERELEEALSLSDLPISAITIGNEEDEAKEDEDQNDQGDNLDFDFDFGSLIGSVSTFDGEMCAADEVFSGGLILPYRNSVSSMSGLRSASRSESMDHRTFGSRSSSIRSNSIRSHYSGTSSSGGSSCNSNYTASSARTVPLVSKTKVRNQFHSYPSPKPQILGTGPRISTQTSPIGKKSKMWEVLKLGLIRTPEIELQDLRLRHRTNNFGKTLTIPRNNSNGSSSSSGSNKASNDYNDRARKSCSIDGNKIDFIMEMEKRKKKLLEIKNGNSSGFFKSCKCSIEDIEQLPTRSNYGPKSGYFGSNKFGNRHNISPANQVSNEDKKLAQRKLQLLQEQQQQEQRRNSHIRQRKQSMSHHHRTFEWLKNLSHASVLN